MPDHAPEPLSDAEAERRIAQPGLLMVDVTAAWCGPCQRLGAVLPKLAAELAGRMAVCTVDADAYPAFVARWQVDAFPRVLLFHDGTVLHRVDGFSGYAAFRDAVDGVLLQVTGAGMADALGEAAFREAAAAAEAAYSAATEPAAEALGRILEPVWPDYQARMETLERQHAAGELTDAAYAEARKVENARIRGLAGPELDAQSAADEVALDAYRHALATATRVFQAGA